MLKISPYFRASLTILFITSFPAILILNITKADFSGVDCFYPSMAISIAILIIALIIFVRTLYFNTESNLFTSIFQGGVRYNSYIFIALLQSLFGSRGDGTL